MNRSKILLLASTLLILACPVMGENSTPSYGIEIWVNLTDEENDDYVRLKSTNFPDYRWTEDCQIRLVGSSSTDVPVTLSSPSGRLGFGSNGAATLNLTLSKNNNLWKHFKITGESGSMNLNDAKIKVKEGNTVLGEEDVTVFYFDPSDITIGLGHSYSLREDPSDATRMIYNPTDGSTVNFSSSGVIKPNGVNCGCDQIKNIKIGINQNCDSSTFTLYYNNPSNPNFHNGHNSATVPSELTQVAQLSESRIDSILLTDVPLYTRLAAALTIPVGCSGGQAAATTDTPQTSSLKTVGHTVKDSMGNAIVDLDYTLHRVTLVANFRTWCVTYNPFDPQTVQVIPLRQTSWSLNVDSNLSNQLATVPSGDSSVSTMPIIDEPLANDDSYGALTPGTGTVTVP